MPGPRKPDFPTSTFRASAPCRSVKTTRRTNSPAAPEAGIDQPTHTARKLRRPQRLLAMALRQGKNLDAGRGHADRMLELRRQRAVARHRGPAVGQDFDVRLAEIDHRLDGEEHAGLQHHAFAGPADMDDVRLVVEHAAEAMAAKVAHHAHALRLHKALDG